MAAGSLPPAEHRYFDILLGARWTDHQAHRAVHGRDDFRSAAQVLPYIFTVLLVPAFAREAISEGPNAGQKTDDMHDYQRLDSVASLLTDLECLEMVRKFVFDGNEYSAENGV